MIKQFSNLISTGEFDIHYETEKTTKGLKVLIKKEDYQVSSVWKNDDDMLVLIKDKENSSYDNEKFDWFEFKN